MIERREFIKRSALVSVLMGMGLDLAASPYRTLSLKVGACDWSIGQNSNPAGLALAKQIGLDGLQVNLGNVENKLHLREYSVQQAYQEQSNKLGIPISSLAIGELNNYPYKSDPQTEQWVSDSIDVAEQMKLPVILLAFFNKNDLREDPKGKQEVIRRLKEVAPKAEKAGVILGIESYLSAAEHLEIIDAVGSPAVKIYYDFRNSADAGHPIYQEIPLLAKEHICEIHIKENGKLLSEGDLDWVKIGELLAQSDYRGSGWMQIEWSTPAGADIVQAYQNNLSFVNQKIKQV
ncbi:sugar phosphate isomerase/epimerase [Algoriphagus sp. A40]|uniref:sugar phosphate isomerase/epimerase family protein n=1 Tax=Algoriphagus sp. A40 TaxID=1945863 RepID=UPI000987D655|nr:sugar phosphate isomerase/epimerase family protein [Algoriphagus sp. A40]OOG78236.1 xylose isomerase [Algoriphagus sp. A40]